MEYRERWIKVTTVPNTPVPIARLCVTLDAFTTIFRGPISLDLPVPQLEAAPVMPAILQTTDLTITLISPLPR